MQGALKSGIRRRYLLLSLSILVFLATAGAGAFVYMKDSQEELSVKREVLYEKQQKLGIVRDSLNDMFFRARGYIAFQSDDELKRVYKDINQVNNALNKLKNVKLNIEEKQMTEELAEFMNTYENEVLPAIIERAGNDDYEALRVFSSNGMTDSVNRFLVYTKQYKVDTDAELEELSEEMLQQVNDFMLAAIVFFLLLFAFIFYLIWRTMNELVKPLEYMKKSAKEGMVNERIVNSINEGIQFVGSDGVMLQQNEALRSILDWGHMPLAEGTEKEQWIDKLAHQSEDPSKMKSFLEKCVSQKEYGVHQYRYRIVEPSARVIDVSSAPVLMEGEKTGTILIHRDITKEHEVERMKTELISTVSHELRTPLSSVLGFTELLLHKQLKPEKQKKYVEAIYKEAKRLVNLINDFLDLQQMESGSQIYRMEELMINELVVEVVTRFCSESSHSFFVMEEASAVKVKGDRERIAQVLTNVMGNAVKFSPDGGHVTVTISNEADQVAVSIHDEGIGIPAEDVPKLFNKFQRVDNSASRKIGGTGLGLIICREIIEKHNGTITIESEEGKGTTVRFSLPVLSSGTSQPV